MYFFLEIDIITGPLIVVTTTMTHVSQQSFRLGSRASPHSARPALRPVSVDVTLSQGRWKWILLM